MKKWQERDSNRPCAMKSWRKVGAEDETTMKEKRGGWGETQVRNVPFYLCGWRLTFTR